MRITDNVHKCIFPVIISIGVGEREQRVIKDRKGSWIPDYGGVVYYRALPVKMFGRWI